MTAAPNSYISRHLPLRLPRVCVAVTGSDPVELIEKAEGLIRDNTFLEFRLDYLSRPALALRKLVKIAEGGGIMMIHLKADQEDRIAEALRSGAYKSPDEVIDRALEVLHPDDEWLRASNGGTA